MQKCHQRQIICNEITIEFYRNYLPALSVFVFWNLTTYYTKPSCI